MHRKVRSRLTYANVVSTLALMVAVGGGAAYAANTVFSTDIVDGQVKNPDLGTNSVRTGKVLNETLTGADIANGSLAGADLGVTVRSGQQPLGACGTVAAYSDCVSVPITNPRPQRLLLIASGEWSTGGSGGTGECIMEVDDNGTFLGRRTFAEIGQGSVPASFAMNATTGIVPAGSHYVDVSCHQISASTTVGDVDLSVVAIGDG